MAGLGTGSRFGACHAALAAVVTVLVLLISAPAFAAQPAPAAWPPVDGPGDLFVHFGEEHINDADGATLLPKVVEQSARYRPDLVTMSGDKANDGEPEQFQLWANVMAAYDREGIPWLAGVGNHDRKAKSGQPGGTDITGDFAPYAEFFADRPYPMGDAPGYPSITPSQRDASDPEGASSHYFADAGNARWVFIDNSCFSIILCNELQNPSGQSPVGEEQLEFLERVGREAGEQGKLVFVVMHMPTRDPGDQLYRDPIAVQHTMGKTAFGVADNTTFEQAAAAAGVDGVFVGHIKGQFLYRGQGNVPYFIDGGAGGELYTEGPVGTDHGYWHGYRLVRVDGGSFETDAVPIFVDGGIELVGPPSVQQRQTQIFEAFGSQPVFNDPAKVPALELRDPDPVPRSSARSGAWTNSIVTWGLPLVALVALLVASALARIDRRRRRLAIPVVVALLGAIGFAGVSAAQQSEPTSTPVESLPNPARIWTSSQPQVLAPVASQSDDPRRDPRSQTADGAFRGRCPGRARLTVTSGFEHRSLRIRVPSAPGPIVRSIRPGRKPLEVGRRTKVARVGLDQRARVLARVFRGKRKVATLKRTCLGSGNKAIRWDGRRGSRAAKPGVYRVQVRVLSDRTAKKRSFRVRVHR